MPTELGGAEVIALICTMIILAVAWKLATGKNPFVEGESPTFDEVNKSYETKD